MSQEGVVVSPFGLSAVSSAQASGISHKIANAISTPVHTRLKVRTLLSASLVPAAGTGEVLRSVSITAMVSSLPGGG